MVIPEAHGGHRMGKQPESPEDSQEDASRGLQHYAFSHTPSSLTQPIYPSQEEKLICLHPLLLLGKEAACSKQKIHPLFTPGAFYTGF